MLSWSEVNVYIAYSVVVVEIQYNRLTNYITGDVRLFALQLFSTRIYNKSVDANKCTKFR